MGKKRRKFTMSIHWGSRATRAESPEASEYEFDSKAERDAFLEGVDEASGWTEYETCEKPCDTCRPAGAEDRRARRRTP